VRNRKLLVLILALALGIVSVLLLSACGTKEETTTTAGAAATGEDLVIGVINSMTGVNALTGAEQKWAQEQAAADQNAKGGIKLADGKMHKVVLKTTRAPTPRPPRPWRSSSRAMASRST
jgi:major membrane immunogen (membrane-anchored lipoprotein)